MGCPKCGRENEDGAVICGACDYILDTAFLGDDILDESSRLSGAALGGDAVILGDLDGEYESFFSEETGSFLSAATTEMARVVAPAEAYVDAPTRALLEPAAVPGLAEGVKLEDPTLSPIERLVAENVDGVRPLARIIKKSGLGEADVRIAIAMLAEKGVLRLVGHAESADVQSVHPDDEVFEDKTRYDDELPDLMQRQADDDAGQTLDGGVPAHLREPPGFDTSTETVVDRGGNRYADLVGIRTREAANEIPGSAFAADEALKDAREALNSGRLNRARMFAKIALSAGADPTVVDGLLSEVRSNPDQRSASADHAVVADLVKRAKAHERKGEYEEAVRLLEEATALGSGLAPVHNQLGVVLATRLKDFERSVEHLLRANELDPARPAYRNNLGKVLRRAASVGWRPADDASERVKEMWSSWKRRMF